MDSTAGGAYAEARRPADGEKGVKAEIELFDESTQPGDPNRRIPLGVSREPGVTQQWGTPEVEGPWDAGAAPMAEAIDWLRTAHLRFMAHVARLDDADLDHERPTNWGEPRPTRWILAAVVGHDFYHAGEINHLRSLLGTDDRWRWQQFEDPSASAG